MFGKATCPLTALSHSSSSMTDSQEMLLTICCCSKKRVFTTRNVGGIWDRSQQSVRAKCSHLCKAVPLSPGTWSWKLLETFPVLGVFIRIVTILLPRRGKYLVLLLFISICCSVRDRDGEGSPAVRGCEMTAASQGVSNSNSHVRQRIWETDVRQAKERCGRFLKYLKRNANETY